MPCCADICSSMPPAAQLLSSCRFDSGARIVLDFTMKHPGTAAAVLLVLVARALFWLLP